MANDALGSDRRGSTIRLKVDKDYFVAHMQSEIDHDAKVECYIRKGDFEKVVKQAIWTEWRGAVETFKNAKYM